MARTNIGALGLLALLAYPLPAGAQSPGRPLLGRVVDGASGQAVSGAEVRVVGPAERSVLTADDGAWRLDGLPPGRYVLRVEHLAYAPAERDLVVAAGERVQTAGDRVQAAGERVQAAGERGAGAGERGAAAGERGAAAGERGAAADERGAAAGGRSAATGREPGSPLLIPLTPRPVVLEALVVTAGRRLQRLADVPVATELVSSREIRETGATDLASVLTERTGVDLAGGHPSGAGVMIQGMSSERVLVLLDGQPFIGRISGAIDVSRIPTSMIERVEVVKGPQSTLYGSEAMGGVVNVITRRPGASAWSASASAAGGGQGRLDLSLGATGGAGPLSGVLDLGRRSIELVPGQEGEGGGQADRWDGSATLGWATPVEGLEVEAGALLLDERQRWRSGPLWQFADNRQWSGRLAAVWERGRHRLVPTLHGSAFDHLSRSATGTEPVPGSGEAETQRLVEGELLYGLGLGPHALDLGVEARREGVTSDRVLGGERTDETVESFAQATLSWGDVALVPGVRATWSEPWGTHWTPRVAALVRPTPAVAVRLSAGEGFRTPAFKERYMDFLNVGPGFGYTVRGNPDLRPEVSRNLGASVEWAGARAYVRLQVFHNRFDDFIETRAVGDSSGVTVYTYGNVDDGVTQGGELEAALTWGGWRIEGGYGVLRAEHADGGTPLLGRPRSSARGVIGHTRPDGLRISLTGLYTGKTAMSVGDAGTVWREGFLRFDARVARELPGGFEVVVGADNVLDERIPDWPGFAGRHLYTALSWRAAGARTETR
jgi:outer membrane receptor for ferrienterochelin and colicins